MFFRFLGNYRNLNEKMWKGILCIWVVLNFDNNLYYCSCNLGEKKFLWIILKYFMLIILKVLVRDYYSLFIGKKGN